jgi:hypothetical protein
MKRIFAVLALFSVVLFSCSKDDKKEASLIGKWQLQSATPDDDYAQCDFEGFIQINSDKSVLAYDKCDDETYNGTWQREGNTVTIINEEMPFPVPVKIISLTETQLVLEVPDFLNDGEFIRETYKRI